MAKSNIRNNFTTLIIVFLVAINIFLSSWSVLHGDINFISDVARDMFLLDEIRQKTFVLIGPRASGLMFHGPLWSYLNYPGFVIGGGNPVFVGWYWIFLIIVFLVAGYVIAKRLFNKITATLFVLMASLYLAFHANSLSNPNGGMFAIPFFFFFFIRYIQTLRIRFLIFHIVTAAAMVQFQIAMGVPFLFLSVLFTTVFVIKKRKANHILAYALVPLLLGNFIVFDIRHEFLIAKNAFRHLGTIDSNVTMWDLVVDRARNILTGMEFLRFGPPNGQTYAIIIFFVFITIQIKNNIHRGIYLVFLYFFFGFFVLSLANRFPLLSFYVFPLHPFVFLMFASFITSPHKRVFVCIFTVIYVLNLVGIYNYINDLNHFIGKNQYSWKAVFTAASTIYQDDEKEFGYFIYSPDILGYGPRYAMEYAKKVYDKNGFGYQKKPITYLLIEPPARDNPFTSEEKWKLYQIHIYSTPVMVKTFDNGYKVEKHLLNAGEIVVPFDPGINPGLHYR
ncbi:hypothetical protein A2875_02415 [Candidatus Gottesmanbacteria bacterium RIFCSPHIGHO2_01_FULL_46_14]|uniref:Glycosyltransferase RgtA/B/C/D-like domain-containing protein n=2 Tax=Candidatus Gottesmaniibacteriota TaxID=1752720 RepID=A0A1F5ZN21_9BACT|nr:MAG: hypothetical protein A2875_02415 [Candidatus Gottesmanbacteria bacterium RIFCSPHIGHO2_01_FULL_46_14]OGG28689.1 MAG: hypothetical protein A2971_02555 [Candidatus Gottesmanbacteria bacterium RIFCSPLOWO2_01_FULL_46_21]